MKTIIKKHNLLPVVPLVEGKKIPYVPWSREENRITDIQTLERVIERDKFIYTDSKGRIQNITDITGFVLITGDIVVIDCDRHGKEDGVEVFDNYVKEHNININTLTVKTPTGGIHYYFKTNYNIKTGAGILPSVDVRGDKGVIVLPGSKREDGTYEVINDVEIQELPNELYALLTTNENTSSRVNIDNIIEYGIQEGTRNDQLLKLANKLRPNFNDITLFAMAVRAINTEYVNPPLELEEAQKIAESVWNYQMTKNDYVLPQDYYFDFDKQWLYKGNPHQQITDDEDEEVEDVKILYRGYLNLQNKLIDIDNNYVQYTLESRVNGVYNKITIDNEQLFGGTDKDIKVLFAKHNGFGNIGFGFSTPKNIMNFLYEQEYYKDVNNLLDINYFTNKVGWVTYEDEKYLVYPDAEVVIDKISVNKTNKEVIKSFNTKGTVQEWIDNVLRNVIKSDNGKMMMLGTFASPIISMLDITENSIMQLEGATSTGKSTCLNGCCSVYGKPQSYMQSWNTTKKGATNLSSMYGSYPMIYDDLKTVDEQLLKQLPELFYTFVSGKGRTVANMNGKGVQDKDSFNNILLTSGEYPITNDLRNHDGAIARVIVLEGSFLPSSKENKIIIDNINNNSVKYYGQVGLDWVKFLVANKCKITEIRQLYDKWVDELSSRTDNKIMRRRCNTLALLKVTGYLLEQFFNKDYFKYNKLIDKMITQLENTTNRLDNNVEAFLYGVDECLLCSNDNNEIFRGGKQIGVIKNNYSYNEKNWGECIVVSKKEFKNILQSNGYNFETVIRQWREDGLLVLSKTNETTINTGTKFGRSIIIKLTKYQELVGNTVKDKDDEVKGNMRRRKINKEGIDTF